MRINKIKATQIELTPAIADYIEKRMRSLEKFVDANDTSAAADVEIGKTTRHHNAGDVFRAEINLTFHGDVLRAVVEKDDLYAAIDLVKEEMVRELRSRKGRTRALMRKGGAIIKDILRGFKKE